MRKLRRKVSACLVLLLGLLFMAGGSAYADVNDFVINNFHGRYELFNDVHGGRMRVTETIELTFSDQNHGILRALPKSYRKHSLKLDVLSVERDGTTEPYTSYEENDNDVLKIGRADRTITGEHVYEIRYEMQNIIGFFEGYDEWYWDINGDQWQQPFEMVRGEVIFPAGWHNQGLPATSCYTGAFGSGLRNCVLNKTNRGYEFAITQPLTSYEGLTMAIAAPKGLFTPTDWWDFTREHIWGIFAIGVWLVAAVWWIKEWWQHAKERKGRGVIVPEYKPPKGLSPAEFGLLADYRVDGRDLTATIVDLALRDYLKIHDDQKTSWHFFKKHIISLELVKTNVSELKEHEKALLEAIFKPMHAGTIQEVAKIDRTNMYKAVQNIRKKLKDTLIKDYGLIEEVPGHISVILTVLFVTLLVILFASESVWVAIVVPLVVVLGRLFIRLIPGQRRSHAGVETYEHIQGLKLYMDTAEKDRLKMLQSVDRPYAEPAKNVKLFEKLLPYAVALGVEKSWAQQFEGIYKQPPEWYNGNMSSFNTVYLAGSLSRSVSAMNTSFSQSSSSSSSGSGGGGFSGGGGGGGGGGGW